MTPEEIVKFAEEAHASLDIERMVGCFDPDAVIYWNGEKVEWVHTRKTSNGDVYDAVAGEFWKMRDGKLLEWHAYCIDTKR